VAWADVKCRGYRPFLGRIHGGCLALGDRHRLESLQRLVPTGASHPIAPLGQAQETAQIRLGLVLSVPLERHDLVSVGEAFECHDSRFTNPNPINRAH
jgi:hypothetical protein